ncbi:Hsp20/alpha crystallin family protein [Maribacter halichondriae]|uniref:Hsp20/alpha crystallin family protein n=1 Tax=Maribacter halichondriae TaxID=2980554 RepID=UPI002359E8B7|nr:Hsp20/alpha crystallin family protein [Maribacter sp. Hal144]
MSIVRRNNLVFPSIMNEIFKPDWFGGMEKLNSSVPAVNIKENEKDFELELAVPGRKKNDFNIEIDNNLLTVSSEMKTANETSEDNYTRREFGFTSFKRAFTLPETIDEDKIKADYVDGLLRCTLPKKKEALPKPKRMIELK